MNLKDFFIQLPQDKYDSFDKFSHPGKKISDHIREIVNIGEELLSFYNINKDKSLFLKYLAIFHDLGKLQKEWWFDNPKKPKHSIPSVEITLEYYLNKLRELSWPEILLFLIAKHHSSLKKGKIDFEFKGRKYSISIEGKIDKLAKEERIELVDTFGIFKLADSLSAEVEREEDLSVKLNRITTKISFSISKLKKIIKRKSKFDKKRWKEQLKLKSLGSPAILQAPTGWGKTFTSILFSFDKNVNRVFYILPTITAIRDFSKKLRELLGEDKVDTYFYFYEVEKEEELDVDTIFFAENFLRPVIITTIDQFLLTFFQIGKYHTKRIAFKNALLIIDEIHLFSELMLKYFIYFYKTYEKIYNFKLLVMSATLPEALVNFLKDSLGISSENYLNFVKGKNLPLRVKIAFIDTDIVNAVDKILNEYNRGKRVLVIVNTVDKCISLAKKLEKLGVKDELIVFHSRFMYRDRLKKEKIILEEYKNRSHILVCTQIAEVSLDISYDILFTELANFASLVQRFGRVNRYNERQINSENCFVFYPNEVEVKRRYPYSKEEIKKAKDLVNLLSVEEIKSDIEIYQVVDELYKGKSYSKLIEEVYSNKGIDLKAWEEIFKFFYSVSFKEEQVKNLLNYREGFSSLVILDDAMIEEEHLKEKIKQVKLLVLKRRKNYLDRRKLLAEIKSLTIPVPFYLVKEDNNVIKGFPIVEIPGYKYNFKYGFHKISVSDIII